MRDGEIQKRTYGGGVAVRNWICEVCGQDVLAAEMPQIKWTDGHVCNFKEVKESGTPKHEDKAAYRVSLTTKILFGHPLFTGREVK